MPWKQKIYEKMKNKFNHQKQIQINTQENVGVHTKMANKSGNVNQFTVPLIIKNSNTFFLHIGFSFLSI